MKKFITIILVQILFGSASLANDSKLMVELPKNFTIPEPESDFDKKLISQVNTAGWYNIHVGKEGARPPFSFTIGHFQQRNHPEIIVVGLPSQIANSLLNVAAVKINGAKERVVPYKKYTDFTKTLAVAFVEVDLKYYQEYLGYANWYYGSLPNSFPVYQMVWPDKQGKFPWEDGYDKRYYKLQPFLSKKT